MPTSQEVFDLRRDGRERRLSLEDVPPLGRIFLLANGDTVRILLPARTDISPMTEETLVAVNKVGNRSAGVISAPGSQIEFLLGSGRLPLVSTYGD